MPHNGALKRKKQRKKEKKKSSSGCWERVPIGLLTNIASGHEEQARNKKSLPLSVYVRVHAIVLPTMVPTTRCSYYGATCQAVGAPSAAKLYIVSFLTAAAFHPTPPTPHPVHWPFPAASSLFISFAPPPPHTHRTSLDLSHRIFLHQVYRKAAGNPSGFYSGIPNNQT